MRLDFSRIQFTPDLMPSDITGTEIMEEDSATGARQLPIRARADVREHGAGGRDQPHAAEDAGGAAGGDAGAQRDGGGETMRLPEPFFVLATQNPIEQEGTYPLPEAQLDRFLFDVRIGYPAEDEEVSILRATTGSAARCAHARAGCVARDGAAAADARDPGGGAGAAYAARLARATRPDSPDAPEIVKRYVRWGAGPRAGQSLILGAKAHALLAGRFAVAPEDIKRVAPPVLRHRVLPNFAAEAEGITAEQVIDEILSRISPPRSDIGL